MDLTIALYSCFAINLIDTKLLMVFVVPGYIVMSMIRMVHLQSMCEVDCNLSQNFAFMFTNVVIVVCVNYV